MTPDERAGQGRPVPDVKIRPRERSLGLFETDDVSGVDDREALHRDARRNTGAADRMNHGERRQPKRADARLLPRREDHAVLDRKLFEELMRDGRGVDRRGGPLLEPPAVIRVRVRYEDRIRSDLRQHSPAVLTEVAKEAESVLLQHE